MHLDPWLSTSCLLRIVELGFHAFFVRGVVRRLLIWHRDRDNIVRPFEDVHDLFVRGLAAAYTVADVGVGAAAYEAVALDDSEGNRRHHMPAGHVVRDVEDSRLRLAVADALVQTELQP